MKIKKSIAAIAALIGTAIPAVCFASPPNPGGYMSFFVGTSAFEDTTITSTQFNPVSTREARTEFDPDMNIGWTGGYDFGYVRLEGEMSYKEGEISRVSEATYGARYVNTEGHIGAFALMMNTFVDIHNDSPVTPYLGGGLGYTSVSITNTKGVDANTGALNYRVFRSDDASAFAYQVGGGVDLALNHHVSLDLGYRYFGTSRVSFTNDWPNSTNLKLGSHNASVGMRIKF